MLLLYCVLSDLSKNNLKEKIEAPFTFSGHPNVKLFMTQCGLQSLEEAVVNHVPMVAIPFMPEQKRNAKILNEKGIGLSLDNRNMTKAALKMTILEVINNPKFKKNTIELANLSKDVEKPGVEKAVWWTEYCLRNKGAKHLKSPAADIPLYQLLLLDVLATVIAVLLVIVIIAFLIIKICVRILRYLLRFICGKDTKIKRKTH
ncbi:unnamed protein product [Acanthoscelides obtectus]|uniref:Glucuronosyltransferase n=1 Tax=Acanthoscelides obtectus TaxID=200917 RepID=A0A9P0K6V3_ACAOB|nr:unnamed protein product [Acanthoscelides obtectus]CAK1683153.1 UDP-glucuronosyltransferase 1-2 [Acanthoscelides obtectus]